MAHKYRSKAQTALNAKANTPENRFKVNDRVWLEAKNLNLPYQARKLAPKRCYALLFFFVLSYLVRIIVSVLIFRVYLVLPAFAAYRTSVLTRDYRDLDT